MVGRFFGILSQRISEHLVFELCGYTSPFEPGEPLEVIGKVGRPYLDPTLALPMVLLNRPMRCFWPAGNCSTAERIVERFALALAMCSGSGRRRIHFCWMWLLNMPRLRKASFFFDR